MTAAATLLYELRSVESVASGLHGPARGGEANRKAPSVSVTGALLTGNFFRGQVVPGRHATNQASRAAGSDYKKGRDCADMFIRPHKRTYARGGAREKRCEK